MPDQDPPVDEYGIPIKRKVSSQAEVDEYGIPVKKKEQSSWANGGLLSKNGGQVGTSEVQSVDTELPSTGQSALSGITSKISVLKSAPKPKKIQAENVVTDYNKSFRDITGTKSNAFTLGSDLPQIKKAREQKEYVSNRNIFETEIKPVQSGVATGTISPQELKTLYGKLYGKKVVADIVRSELPELEINDFEPNAMRPNEDKFGEIAQQLQAKNRQQGVDAQNQSEFNLDNELSTTLSSSTYGADRIGVRGGGESFTERKQDNFGDINTSSASELSDALRKINSSTKVWDADGKEVDKKILSEKIKNRIFQLKAGEDIHPEIAQEQEMIAKVVEAMPVEYKRQGGAANNERDAEYVMSGLSYIRDTKPGEYNAIMSTMKVTGKMPETTYTELANIGRDVRFYKDFKSGDYVEQDDRSFLTPQLKKANLAGWLSEDLARKGFRNRSAFTQKEILESYQNAPDELKDDELVADIIKAERAPSLGFIPIPQGEGLAKKGVLNSAMRGAATPIGDILNSVEVGFNSSYKSPFDAYLKSKELDRGNQTIINKKGDFSKTLDENFWNKGVEGFFNLMTQAAIARGIGNAVKMPLNAAIGRVDPRAAITSNQAALSMGTPLSTMAQTFGSEYMDFLEKTGSPTKATLGALASGLVQGQIERFVMPDVKLVDDLNLLTARKNFAKEIINVVDNGGGRKGVADVVKDYVGNVTKIIGKEAWLEEGAQNFTNYLTEQIISPKTAQDRDLLKETVDTGLAATAQMGLFSLLGAAGQTKMQQGLGKAQLNSIAANPEQFIDALGNQLAKGEISKPDYDLSTQIINKHRENNLNAPKTDANGELISAERQLEYAYQSTVADIAQQQANKISDKIQREPLEKKIAEADKIKRQIFYGEENKDLPSKEGEPIAIAPELKERESELDNAAAIAKTANIQGYTADIIKDAAENDPKQFEEFLSEIAQQAYDERSAQLTVETYGQDLVDAAKKLFPQEQSPATLDFDYESGEPVVSGGGNVKGLADNADLMRDVLDEYSIDKDGGALLFEEIDNIHNAITQYEAGVISGEELKKEFIKNGVDEAYLSKKMVENGMAENIELPLPKEQVTESTTTPTNSTEKAEPYADKFKRLMTKNSETNKKRQEFLSNMEEMSSDDVKKISDEIAKESEEFVKEMEELSSRKKEQDIEKIITDETTSVAEEVAEPEFLKGDTVLAFEDGNSLHKKKYRVFEQRGDTVILETLDGNSQVRRNIKGVELVKKNKKDETTNIEQPNKEDKQSNQSTEEAKPTDEAANKNAQPPIPPTEEGAVAEEESPKLKDKGVLTHLYKAKNVPEAAKKGFEQEGLQYQTKSQEEAAGVAKALVEEVGIEEAVSLAEKQTFDGDVNSLIFAEALNKLKEQEDAATTPEEKVEIAKQFAEIAITYDKMARVGGRFNAAINHFYKKSPLGIVMMENAKRKDEFNKWAKPNNKSWQEFFEELKKEPEFEKIYKENVNADLKKERAEAREKRKEKAQAAFKKAKDQFKGGAAYSTIIPPKVIVAAIDIMEKAYLAGEAVAKVIQQGIDYISTEIKTSAWDTDKFKKEWEAVLKEGGGKKPLTDEELKTKVLDKFRKKLNGLTDKQKDEVIRKAHRKLIENGALDFDDFKEIIGRVTGRAELTPEDIVKIKDLVKKTNAVEEAAVKVRTERTEESFVQFTKAEIEAGRAARDLNDLFHSSPDIIKRLTSIMQLSTLGIPALINNPIYNFWNQLLLRFPIGLTNDLIDRGISGAAMLAGKNYDREFNVLETQGEFWSKLGLGAKESMQQIGTGLNRQDYISKEVFAQIRPFKSLRDLAANARGKKPLSKKDWWDKAIQGTVGIPAEIVARLLNVGDKPMRFGAEGSQAAAFSKALGLKGIDHKIFAQFPREEAYRHYKAEGFSDEVAGQKADYVREAIIKEGERSTFQQDNMLNDALTRAFGVLGGKDSGTAQLTKSLAISPYIKIPSNAFWSLYNLVNPEIAMLQAGIHAANAQRQKKKGEITKSKLQNREARYWLAHGIVGVALRGTILMLVKAGIFTPSPDDDESKKERDANAFYDKPGTMKVGNLQVSNRWFGLLGAMGNIISKKYKDMTPEQKQNSDEFWNIAFGGMEIEALEELENGIFANSSSLLQSLSNGDWSRYGVNTLNLFANIIQPAAVAQINRAALDEVPSSKGDTFLQKLNNNFAQRSTLYRWATNTELKPKRDIWGEPIPKGGNMISRLFGVSKGNPQLFGRPVYDDAIRTNDTGFLPPAVLPTLNGEKLNTEQHDRLTKYIGQERKKLVQPYVNDMAEIEGFQEKYSQLKSDEDKKFVLQYLYGEGRDKGVELFYTDYPQLRPAKEEPDYKKDVQKTIFKSLKSIQ